MKKSILLSVFFTKLFSLVSGTLKVTQTSDEFTEILLSGVRALATRHDLRSLHCYAGKFEQLLVANSASYGADFNCHETLGTMNSESRAFYGKCTRLCKHHSRMECRTKWSNREKFLQGCHRGSTLGSKKAPTCCFFRRCFQIMRPRTRGVRRFWWREDSVRKMLTRKGC